MHQSNRGLFLQYMAQTSPEPMLLEIEKAQGHYLFATDGKKYLDLIAGISVSSLGHGHPDIVAATQTQAARHMHLMVYGELVQSPQVQLAQTMAQDLPAQLQSVYLVNSGTEATEGAMKLAKRITGKTGFAAHTQAYHGSTQGALSLMDAEYFTAAYRPLLPNVTFIQQNNIEGIQQLGPNIAAVIVEPVQAEKGAIPCTPEYLKALRNWCTQNNTLLVFDEIQTGMGRTGTLFAFEQMGVIPDILLLGKAFGGGMPLAAFVSSHHNMNAFTHNPVLGHITTFGGHPVSCAAALAAWNITRNQLSGFNVAQKSELFKQKLVHSKISRVTGMGLLLAVHLPDAETCQKLIRICLQKGVFTDWFLHAPECLRIAPPLSITEDEINIACQAIIEALNEI